MRVLVACERSGAVRSAFEAAGHEAWSCDLQSCDVPGLHHQGSVFDLIDYYWDLVIAFPPCTYLSSAQEHMVQRDRDRYARQLAAVRFVNRIWHSFPRVALENPPGALSRLWRPYSQVVRPWYFGDPWQKSVCLWLKRVPPLIATCYSTGRRSVVNRGNGQMSSQDRGNARSTWSIYPGMCQAMASQWTEKSLGLTSSPLVYP